MAFEGDVAELAKTRNAQPAILAASVVALRCAENVTGLSLTQGPNPKSTCTTPTRLGSILRWLLLECCRSRAQCASFMFRGDVMQEAVDFQRMSWLFCYGSGSRMSIGFTTRLQELVPGGQSLPSGQSEL